MILETAVLIELFAKGASLAVAVYLTLKEKEKNS
jgi:hypothetical protein